jgi:hypothetical protein
MSKFFFVTSTFVSFPGSFVRYWFEFFRINLVDVFFIHWDRIIIHRTIIHRRILIIGFCIYVVSIFFAGCWVQVDIVCLSFRGNSCDIAVYLQYSLRWYVRRILRICITGVLPVYLPLVPRINIFLQHRRRSFLGFWCCLLAHVMSHVSASRT